MRCSSSCRSRRPRTSSAAYAAARAAQVEWAARPLKERLAVFKRAHTLFIDNAQTTTDLIQVESGKNRRMAIEETCDPVMVMSHYLKRAPKLLKPVKRGGPVPLVSTSTEIRQPKGVIGIIAPWNFPFATGISDSISALMAGNGIVLKPDNKTALSPLYGVQMLEEAGLPKGLFQVVCGEGPDVGPTLIDNANYVMFTGSTATGRVIGERAGRNLIGCCLELGGKNPMIVLEDANLDEVVQGAMFGAFGNTGQICMHIERMYLPGVEVRRVPATRFVAATEALTLGASYDFGPDVGSLVSPDHKDRVQSHVEDAVAKGATVLTGGKAAARPRAGVLRADDPRGRHQGHAGRRHRDLRSGRRAAPLLAPSTRPSRSPTTPTTASTPRCGAATSRTPAQVGRRIESGNVNVNDILATAFASKGTPSGGVKQSGVGARHGDQGLLKYTDVQNLAVLKKQVMGARPGPGLRQVRQGDARRAQDDAEDPHPLSCLTASNSVSSQLPRGCSTADSGSDTELLLTVAERQAPRWSRSSLAWRTSRSGSSVPNLRTVSSYSVRSRRLVAARCVAPQVSPHDVRDAQSLMAELRCRAASRRGPPGMPAPAATPPASGGLSLISPKNSKMWRSTRMSPHATRPLSSRTGNCGSVVPEPELLHQDAGQRLGQVGGLRPGRTRPRARVRRMMRPVRHDRAGVLERRSWYAHAHGGIAGDLAVRLAVLPSDVDRGAGEVEDVEPVDPHHLLLAVAREVVLDAVLGPRVRRAGAGDVHVRIRRVQDREPVLVGARVVAGDEGPRHPPGGSAGPESMASAVLVQRLPRRAVGVDAAPDHDQLAGPDQHADVRGRQAAVASLGSGDEPVVGGHRAPDLEIHARGLPGVRAAPPSNPAAVEDGSAA